MLRVLTVVAILTLSAAACTDNSGPSASAPPKNIILFIGDGMGISQITSGKIVRNHLRLDEFKVLGLVTTHAEGDLVTDSASSATAMATGSKTINGAIAVTAGSKPLKTVFEYGEDRGMATGVVATSSVTHATPASFMAHVLKRGEYARIAEHIAASGVDVLIGGGWGYFVPQGEEQSRREDNQDLLASMGEDMEVVRTLEDLRALHGKARFAGLLEPNHLPEAKDRSYTLSELTSKALDGLAMNSSGFVLMVEGSQIDWAGHGNDGSGIVSEFLDFDEAVGVGLDFAKENGETLVVVTADHETGGFAIHEGSMEEGIVSQTAFTTDGHTAAMVPIFAFGPEAGRFAGIQDNTAIGAALIEFIRK